MSEDQEGFVQGVAWAVSIISRYHIGPGELLKQSGIPYSDFKKAKVIASDLAAIRKVMKLEGMPLK